MAENDDNNYLIIKESIETVVTEKPTGGITCSVCGVSMKVKPSHLKRMKHPERITCSSHCCSEARRAWMTGEGNHQFGLKGELNSSFISDARLSSYGYILVMLPSHPMAMGDGRILFHRLVMEEFLLTTGQYQYLIEVLGRWVLNPAFIVHHLDENRLNNAIDNLELMTLEEHQAHHAAEHSKLRGRDQLGRWTGGEIKSGKLSRNKKLDAGQDVFASEDTVIPAGGSKLVLTNLMINVPAGFVGLLWSRSGLSVGHKVEVGAGCIDSGYHGEVKVHLYNFGADDYHVLVGDKIAQLLTIPIDLREYNKVDEFTEQSDRGNAGFGSSGR